MLIHIWYPQSYSEYNSIFGSMYSSNNDHGILLLQTLVSFATITVIAVVVHIIGARSRRSTDPYAIDPCPYPNCIRCQQYASVQRQAVRKLPWITQKTSENLARIVDGVQLGIRPRTNKRRSVGESPAVGQYPTVLLVPRLAAQPNVSSLHSRASQTVANSMRAITKECLCSDQPHDWSHNFVGKESKTPWTVLYLMNQGRWAEDTILRHFNRTLSTLGLLDLMNNCIFGNVFLSRLTPGGVIAPHCGPSNVRHRMHVTLKARSSCSKRRPSLLVRETTLHWTQDEIFVFDDSLIHSVEYPFGDNTAAGDNERIVLIVDLWHPDLSPSERAAVCDLYPCSRVA